MSYKTYGELQEVDNTFFKQIPLHWNIFKLKYLINSLESGKRKDFESEDYAFSLGGEHINWNGTLNLKNKRYISKNFYNSMNKGKIQENDTLLVKDGATIGKTAFVDKLTQKMAVNEHVFIIRNNHQLIPKLLYYLIASNLGFTQIKLTETGSAQGGISQDILDKVNFAIPNSLQEQQQIANYLDKKTSKIDITIAKNKELINLLEEKRTALINQVVTKGLNPEVPMKDSGIEWIGEIPKYYSIIKLKFLTSKIGSGKTPKGGSEIYVSEGIPLLRSQNIHFDSIRLDDVVYITEEINQTMLSTVVKNNDVLLNITGASIGRCNYIEDINIANVNQHVCIIRPNKKIFYKYLNYFLQSDCGQNQVFLNQNGTSREGLNFEDLSNFYIILPNDIKEQKTVVLYLEKEIMKIYTIINKVKENIELLDEYKTSLIHHVVTAKIDVRCEN